MFQLINAELSQQNTTENGTTNDGIIEDTFAWHVNLFDTGFTKYIGAHYTYSWSALSKYHANDLIWIIDAISLVMKLNRTRTQNWVHNLQNLIIAQ